MYQNNTFTRKSEGRSSQKEAPPCLTSNERHNLSTYYDLLVKERVEMGESESQEYKRAGQGESESEPIREQAIYERAREGEHV